MPARLGVRALVARAALGRVDACEGQQLIEVVEAADVADLGDQDRARRRTEARDGLQPARQLTVEQ
jgi:hypothetical protein